MKKNNKKGFTIVELVIVIAVIAILAAVLIPTFSSIIKKAKVNNDIQLVRNLNTALATDNKKHKTMQSALDAAFEFGYDVAKINNTSVEENEILWDSKNDVFCYLKDSTLEYVPNSVADDDKLSVNSYLLWKISKTVDPTYSTYYTGDATTFTGENAITKGFDAGTTKGITAIEYENNTDQKVVIRTNSFATTLTINDRSAQGKIYHYDNLGKLIITHCAMESYHEMGIVGYAELQKGHLAVEENASINLLFANPQDSATLKITNNGTVTNAQASSETVKNTISGVNFNRASGAVSDTVIQQAVQETHQSNCEHANIVVSKAKDPTCTETGLTAGESCADCHKVLIAQEVVPATGRHYYTDNICTVCGTPDPTKVLDMLANGGFKNKTNLTNIVIPNSVTTIRSNAFYGCTGLTSVTIPDSVTTLGSSVFEGCTELTNVTLGNGVKTISGSAFKGCTKLTNVTLPGSVTMLGSNVFEGCTGLTSIVIPDSVTTIYSSAFKGCTELTNVTLGNKVKIINDYVFQNCTGLTNVTLPEGVTEIKQYAFDGCTALETITLPSTVETIGAYAFKNSGLTEIKLPANLQDLAATAFYGCTSLDFSKITVATGNTTYTVSNKCILKGDTLLIGCKDSQIPNTVKTIGSNAFYDCTGLTSITIPDTVTSIGSSAFRKCTDLTSVTIGSGVTEIGSYAFEGCTGLTSVTIGSGVTKIGSYAFSGCTNLADVTFENASGWTTSGGTVPITENLSNIKTAATCLKETYVSKTWTRT